MILCLYYGIRQILVNGFKTRGKIIARYEVFSNTPYGIATLALAYLFQFSKLLFSVKLVLEGALTGDRSWSDLGISYSDIILIWNKIVAQCISNH